MAQDNLSVPFAETLADSEALARSLSDLETRSGRFGTALSGALKSATLSGKSLEDVLQGLGNRLTDIALSAALKPLEGAVSSAASSLVGSLGSVTAFADGGVVRSPSLFPMEGNRLGLMGEAGAEAILPLARGADGTLGVAMTGGGEGTTAPIIFNVTAADAASFRKSEGQISAMLARSVSRGRRGL
ncbi:phage tail tape measure protein [Affinirhizobium pseudoryzae]|uniref:phage tail tape measure protein n=1 Tax=Allorhizobium pseudoryzae TaxID=379684 RepID=UPI0013EDD6FB|nr:phage tail tape measure protein [Allorhizobium pseudoryzae]